MLANPVQSQRAGRRQHKSPKTFGLFVRKEIQSKAFAAGANAFPNCLGAWHTRPRYIAALGFVCNYLRRRFIDFKLRAYLLDLPGLLLQLGCQNLHPLLLLRDGGFQALHFLVLFEELVEQHRVDLLVAHGRDFTILVRTTRSGFTVATSSAIKPY